MSASLALFKGDPAAVMVTRKVSENITTFSVPFARFGHMKIGGRGTVGTRPYFQSTKDLDELTLTKSDYLPAHSLSSPQ